MAYAYVTRQLASTTLNSSDDEDEAIRLLSEHIPFLTSPSSTTLYTSLEDAFLSTLPSSDPSLYPIILNDLSILLHPTITGIHNALRALCDLHVVFKKKERVKRKLVFYAACLNSWDFDEALMLKEEVLMRCRMERTALESRGTAAVAEDGERERTLLVDGSSGPTGKQRGTAETGSRIVEI